MQEARSRQDGARRRGSGQRRSVAPVSLIKPLTPEHFRRVFSVAKSSRSRYRKDGKDRRRETTKSPAFLMQVRRFGSRRGTKRDARPSGPAAQRPSGPAAQRPSRQCRQPAPSAPWRRAPAPRAGVCRLQRRAFGDAALPCRGKGALPVCGIDAVCPCGAKALQSWRA